MCIAILPTKTCAPLIVDTNAPLPYPIARQFFQLITGRHTQIIDCCGYYRRLASNSVTLGIHTDFAG